MIPARNEQDNVRSTCVSILRKFAEHSISDYEILVVNDNSSDRTEAALRNLTDEFSDVKYVNNTPPHGFGFAVRKGLEHYRGQAVCIVMADLSDSPDDIVKYYLKLREGYECVFGSRFLRGSTVIDYPMPKFVVNRLANLFIRLLFRLDYNDITNAFKCYRREVIEGIQPILSNHFNITVELPLKAIVRGFSYAIMPISWTNRRTGMSHFKLQEMGSRYVFIVLYVLFEKLLSRGDYRRRDPQKNESSR